jgi:hypothetical protein
MVKVNQKPLDKENWILINSQQKKKKNKIKDPENFCNVICWALIVEHKNSIMIRRLKINIACRYL